MNGLNWRLGENGQIVIDQKLGNDDVSIAGIVDQVKLQNTIGTDSDHIRIELFMVDELLEGEHLVSAPVSVFGGCHSGQLGRQRLSRQFEEFATQRSQARQRHQSFITVIDEIHQIVFANLMFHPDPVKQSRFGVQCSIRTVDNDRIVSHDQLGVIGKLVKILQSLKQYEMFE